MEQSDEIVVLADVRHSLKARRPPEQNDVRMERDDGRRECSVILFSGKAHPNPARKPGK
ncbi:hypothetical protein [Rhizobium sp. C4]|uniref:hypothetical protein n=1 Tax=Rhizobium sp. C4 TaxID=1349800 RepID=UPI001E627B7B|nr:hypothetical protein [Rhizobium sp. C4]MCD2175138.1 hypothetical protein [Rhizobium sp. C4]